MNELNEKLGELCGLAIYDKSKCPGCKLSADRQRCAFDQGGDCPRLHMPDYIDAEGHMVFDWTPTADLNQLKIVARVALDSISNDAADIFTEALKQVYVEMTDSEECGEIALALMWIDRPELVAQSILKAKEVS